MDDNLALEALVRDLQWQIDQLRPRGVKNEAGRPYNPSHYKRGLESAIAGGGTEVREFVSRYLYKPPSGSYKRLEEHGSLDLACEALVADDTKPYAHLFSDEDREAARARLGPNAEAVVQRTAEHRARIDAARARIRKEGMPTRYDLDSQLRSRRARA